MHTAIPCCTINGEQPALRGQVCQSLLIQEWWWEGRPADPVNVVYLQFEQRWYRLYFEGETVFWRSGEAPRPCENDEGPGARPRPAARPGRRAPAGPGVRPQRPDPGQPLRLRRRPAPEFPALPRRRPDPGALSAVDYLRGLARAVASATSGSSGQ